MSPYTYDFEHLNTLFYSILEQNVSEQVLTWLNQAAEQASTPVPSTKFNVAFAMIPRKLPSKPMQLTAEQAQSLEKEFNLHTESWDNQRFCRVWLLLQIPTEDKEAYLSKINNLFGLAEMNELATLYAALPVLAFPKEWILRCAEGIRSNIGIVLDAIIMDNPYPSQYLDDNAWNQLILKAFFTEKDIDKIIGIKKRANQPLADSLKDYIAERKAAGREINPKLWELIETNELEK